MLGFSANYFYSSTLLLAASLLAGCGCDYKCNACDTDADGVTLRFSSDSLQGTGFRRVEVNSAFIVRYANQNFTGASDTIRQQSGRGQYLDFYQSGLNLNLLPPPALPPGTTGYATVTRFTKNSFRIVVPAISQQYDISELDLAGETSSGCCACYRNTRRRFTLNGQYVTADGRPGITTLMR